MKPCKKCGGKELVKNGFNQQKIINEEIEKCVILCANCHREVEAGVREL